MTIYEIKNRTRKTAPNFFDRETLKFFGQAMKSFRVKKQPDGRYRISAPIRGHGAFMGMTVRYFDPITNKLELEE